MKLVYDINLFIHAAAGLLSLVVLAIPLVAKKGGQLHRRAGWVFTIAMAVVALTGLGLALAWALVPLQVKPLDADASAERIAAATRSLRAFGLFFATIGLMSGAAVWHGISAIRINKAQTARATFVIIDHLAWALLGLFGLALLLLGLRVSMPLFSLFGALALFNAVSDARFLLRPPNRKSAWLIRHLQAMLGGATVAITAFAVLVLRRYLDPSGGFQLAFWLVPVAFGTFGTIAWTRIWQRRLGYGRPSATT
ncbi:hypothetical protein [Enhygromyxa salina]|uniref:DUF2306 domain-containing protein n=1 Tax=Enhygromyxa salina TaxID=215803 RepID=A0A2S9YTU0_9BACT|nr:hypothetical protein [Enhygromyxa salina]PRQ08531.1 hypothetical protein ENSA7_18170 [Enhygromyxa salina]